MTTERSDAVHAKWRESTEKFDYFMLGVCGALCAFVAQGYQPQRIGWNAGTLELLALLMLVLSAIVGFRRIEYTNLAMVLNHQQLHAYERRGMMMQVIHHGPGINTATGDAYTPEAAFREIAELDRRIEICSQDVKRAQAKARTQYTGRNWLLLLGFLVLVAAKVATAYQ